MNAGVERRKAIERVDQRLVLEHLDAILEADDANLADAADARAGSLHIDDDEVGYRGVQSGRCRLLKGHGCHYARPARLRNVIDQRGRSISTMLCSHS